MKHLLNKNIRVNYTVHLGNRDELWKSEGVCADVSDGFITIDDSFKRKPILIAISQVVTVEVLE